MRLGVRDLFGDAAAPDSGFNRIIGEEKIRKGMEGRKGEGGRRGDSDIGTGKEKPACYCSSLPVSDALSERERPTATRCGSDADMGWRRRRWQRRRRPITVDDMMARRKQGAGAPDGESRITFSKCRYRSEYEVAAPRRYMSCSRFSSPQ